MDLTGILDLFAGPGGWSEGLRALGLADLGIELDPIACDVNPLRRLFGLQYIRVIDEVKHLGYDLFEVTKQHFEWQRVRPWWKVWHS